MSTEPKIRWVSDIDSVEKRVIGWSMDSEQWVVYRDDGSVIDEYDFDPTEVFDWWFENQVDAIDMLLSRLISEKDAISATIEDLEWEKQCLIGSDVQ